jgi:hypothetical protein
VRYASPAIILAYLNEVLPAIQLDDDDEGRRRAAAIVPKLNAKNEDELRADMDLPRMFPRGDAKPFPAPPPAEHSTTTVERRKGPFYEYPKAVLQVVAASAAYHSIWNGVPASEIDGRLAALDDFMKELARNRAAMWGLN